MRFQIWSLLIIVSFINCQRNTFTYASHTEGSCADNVSIESSDESFLLNNMTRK